MQIIFTAIAAAEWMYDLLSFSPYFLILFFGVCHGIYSTTHIYITQGGYKIRVKERERHVLYFVERKKKSVKEEEDIATKSTLIY